MQNCLIVGAGGAIGSIFRYLIGLLNVQPQSGFPVKTLFINILGAFVIGLVTALAAKNGTLDSRLVLLLKVGVCGGFTTFSSFAYETSGLMQAAQTAVALAYVLLSVTLGVLAVFAAQLLVH
ncbi:MAG: fluoride efflux transporter CrcB [Oscillospiraceae bacterium]|jgi:CrcB protein